MSQNFVPDGRLDHDSVIPELHRFLDQTLGALQLGLRYEIRAFPGQNDEPELLVTFEGADRDLLLEKQAELLLALEHLAVRWLRLDPRLHDRIRFDAGDFRALRLEELKLSARAAAERVRETGRPFRFQPLPARERRIIHLELSGAPGVRTLSEGTGERRQLVVYPANSE